MRELRKVCNGSFGLNIRWNLNIWREMLKNLTVNEREMADFQFWAGNRSGRHQPIFEGGKIPSLFGEIPHFLITSQPPPNVVTINPQKVSQTHDVV